MTTTPDLARAVLGFDLETTGIDVENDRIVTAYAGLIASDGTILDEIDLLVAPSEPDGTPISIPDGAAAVHGVTNEILGAAIRGEGPLAGQRVHTPVQALNRLSIFLDSYTSKGIPLAGSNLAYDLTLLDREARRHLNAGDAFTTWLLGGPYNAAGVRVLDSLVIDKGIDKYRKGSRKLVDLAAHYGIHLTEEEAHGSRADAIAAARITQRQLGRPALAGLSLDEIHRKQVAWKAEQAASLQAYFRSPKAGAKRDPTAVIDGHWPLKPFGA